MMPPTLGPFPLRPPYVAVLDSEISNLKSEIPRPCVVNGRYDCPCGASHSRGALDPASNVYRCLRCGETHTVKPISIRRPCVIDGRFHCVCGDSFLLTGCVTNPDARNNIRCDCGRLYRSIEIQWAVSPAQPEPIPTLGPSAPRPLGPCSSNNPPAPECSTPPAPANDATDGGTPGNGVPTQAARRSAAVRGCSTSGPGRPRPDAAMLLEVHAMLERAISGIADATFILFGNSGPAPTRETFNLAANAVALAERLKTEILAWAMSGRLSGSFLSTPSSPVGADPEPAPAAAE